MSEIPALDAGAVLWSVPPAERGDAPLLVLLHGYGSHEGDLFALAELLPDEFVAAALRAPLTPPFPTPGHSWFPIEGLHGRAPGGATAAAERVLEWIDGVAPGAKVGILGFSQGGVVALQALRLRPDTVAFVVNLAGFVDADPLPGDEALADRRPPVFWGRGARDEVIPEGRIAHTVEWLPAHSELSGRVYPGLAHSVSQEEIDDVVTFLRLQLDAS